MKNFKFKKYYLPAVLVSLIIIISLFFHYSIHITDAITLNELPDFGIRISNWRILFEPFIGVLLFFNRALYALNEFPMVLIWILAFFVFYTIIRSVNIKKKQSKKRFLIRQLVNLPIVIGLWFLVFILLIFIPLPNNTIVNNSPSAILVTTHSHTEYSHDGLISQEGLWKWHKRNGFDAFFITDHNNHDKTLDFVNAQRNHEFPSEPLVMCGEEFSGSNHLSLLGLKRKFRTGGYADSTVIDSVRAGNGAVIVNHWFDGEHMSLEYYKNLGVDGFEIANTATDRSYNREVYRRIKAFCETNHLIMNGGLDFHGYGNVCSLWNAFEIPGWHDLDPASKEEAILNVIKTRDQSRLRVLLYQDRPYYSGEYLFWSPVFTVFNYFRTLNFYQVISWTFWILLFSLIKFKISRSEEFRKRVSINRVLPVLGVLSAVFMLVLGIHYSLRIKDIPDFTEMYAEYSQLLFYIGGAFLLYSGIVVFFRIFSKKAEMVSTK